MVRDPSIVSPSLTGVFIGGGHNKHGTGSRCTLPKQCRPPSPRRRWRCDRSSYRRNLFSRIRVSLAHCLTGPEIAATLPVTVSGLCGIEPLRDGQAHRSSLLLYSGSLVGGRPGRPGAAPRGEVGGGRAPRHRAGHAGTQPGPARGARGPGANLLHLHGCSEFWWFEKRSAQSVVARNAMPPPGDMDGAVRSDEAGEAPHSVVVLPATSDLSSTLRPFGGARSSRAR